MSKFPVVRDLWVDRARMFEDLKRVYGWVPIDGTHHLGPGPRESPEKQEFRYALSRCMTCGCCLEACPQYTKDNHFVGPQAMGQALYFNLHETGKELQGERLEALMGPGGINDCGNAQNCVKVCPKEVPLTEAIAHLGRQTTVHAIKKFFTGGSKRSSGGHAD
jgi:succinate dehydrogenase / fumarate reductase iron-sulfur subunit